MDGIFMWAINQNIWNKKYHYQYTLKIQKYIYIESYFNF